VKNSWRVALGAALVLVLAALPLGGVADADGGPAPSAGDLRTARQLTDRRAAQVAAVEQQLAAARAAEQELDVRAELAVERYDGALLRRQQAEAAAGLAAAASVRAQADRRTATDAAGQLAAEQYRTGLPAGLAGLGGLVQAQNLQAATSGRAALRAVTDRARRVVDSATDSAAEAAATAGAAARAAAAAQRAAAVVAQAQQQVADRLAAQRVELAALAARSTSLLAQLAAAEQVSVELAGQREQALTEAAAGASAEAARQTALHAAAPAQSGRPSDSDAAAGPARSSGPVDPGAAVSFARAQLGLPYVWGGAGPDSFDCSGLTMRAWQRAGVELPHYAADQYARSRPLSYGQLRPGDLVFWSHDGSPQDIYHVALYIGDDRMIEAPRTGAYVKVASLWIMGVPNYYARP